MNGIQMIAPIRRVGAFRRGIARMFDMVLALFAGSYLINLTFPMMFSDKANRLEELGKMVAQWREQEVQYTDFAEYIEYMKLVNFHSLFMFMAAIIILVMATLIVNALAKGQTIGKLLGGLRVVNQDGSQARWYILAIRELMSWGFIFILMIISSVIAMQGVSYLALPISVISALFMASIVLSTIIKRRPGEIVKQTWYDKLLKLEVIVK